MAAVDLMVAISDPACPTADERGAIHDNCERYGLSFYRLPTSERGAIAAFWRQFGLSEAIPNPQSGPDGISCITPVEDSRYIPYTTKALEWHTDGCYSEPFVRSFTMHCVRPAVSGGGNSYFNHVTLYRILKEIDPGHVAAVSRPDAMAVPANEHEGKMLRETRIAPVFWFDDEGDLLMRWTGRARNIIWKQDAASVAARRAIHDILRRRREFRIDYTLGHDEGVICNNVLHRRGAFEDDPAAPRLLLRGRYAVKLRRTVSP